MRSMVGKSLLGLLLTAALISEELVTKVNADKTEDHQDLRLTRKSFNPWASDGRHRITPQSYVKPSGHDWQGINDPLYLYFYSAHVDDRGDMHKVVMTALTNPDSIEDYPLLCQIWTEEGVIEVSAASLSITNDVGVTSTGVAVAFVLVKCPFSPGTTPTNVAVSLAEINHQPSPQTVAALEILHPVKAQVKPKLAACISPLWKPNKERYPPLEASVVVEWIEMQKMLGVEHFSFYIRSVPMNVYQVLMYYQQQNVVSVRSMGAIADDLYELPGMTATMDCMLQYMHSHEKVLMLDVDEVIVPQEDITLVQLLDQLKEDHPLQSHYHVQNVNFITTERQSEKSKPSHSTFLQHRHHEKLMPNYDSGTTIQDPFVCWLSSQQKCLKDVNAAESMQVSPQVAMSFRYRDCFMEEEDLMNCEHELKDDLRMRYEERLLPVVNKARRDLHLDG